METITEEKFSELEMDWQTLVERVKKKPFPEDIKIGFDLTNHSLLKQLIRYDSGLKAELNRLNPELLEHPLLTLRTVDFDVDTFSVAHPQAGTENHLVLSHTTYVDTGSSYHYNSIAIFDSAMMGNLGTEHPGIELWYRFPDDSSVISYNVQFKIFLYSSAYGRPSENNRPGADFQLSKNQWGHQTAPRFQHVDFLTSDEDTPRYLNIRVPASQVRGRLFIFKIEHLDWSDSNTVWWFYSAKVTKTYLG